MASAVALLAIAAGAATAVELTRGDRGADAAERATGSATRLGPNDGERVADYVNRAGQTLARRSDTGATYALVALDRYVDPDGFGGDFEGVSVVRALARVPLPRVQTRIVELPGGASAQLTGAMSAAAAQLRREAGDRSTDALGAAVARAEADRLAAGCDCLLGAVVRAEPAALTRLADRPGIRVVEAAPHGEPLARLAFSPLLPEQQTVVEPPPDDGASALLTGSPPAPTPTSQPRGDTSEAGPSGASR